MNWRKAVTTSGELFLLNETKKEVWVTDEQGNRDLINGTPDAFYKFRTDIVSLIDIPEPE